MAMHQGFDLSRFKKISSDAKSTTMRHSNGHEVKIVHSGLSPGMRAQVDALPMAETPAKMARGGMVKKMAEGGDPADFQAMDPTSPAPAPDDANVSDIPPAAPAETDDSGVSDLPPAPEDNDPNTINVIGVKTKPIQMAPTMQQFQQDNAAWAQDQQNGHITPETYQSLFAKKDTLGKIGTLFGLVVGGAGAGLAHQPNMAMDMMNRTIQNDLQAQTQSKANAVNYFNAKVAGLQGIANAQQIAAHTAQMDMRTSVYHNLFQNIGKMPPGPTQQAALQLLQGPFLQGINAENTKDAAHATLAANQGPEAQQQSFEGPVNKSVLTSLNFAAPDMAPAANAEGDRVFQTRTQFDNYTHAYKRLNTLTAGQGSDAIKVAADIAASTPLGAIAAMGGVTKNVADLATQFQQEREAEKAAMPGVPEQFLPSGYDFIPGVGGEKTRAEKANRAAAFFKLQEGLNPTLNTLQKNGLNVMTPQPYDSWAASMKQKSQPKGIGGRKQPLATPEQARAGNVFPDQPPSNK